MGKFKFRFRTIKAPLPQALITAAERLRTGVIEFAYIDGTQIRMETKRGLNPYVWRNGHWRTMRPPIDTGTLRRN